MTFRIPQIFHGKTVWELSIVNPVLLYGLLSLYTFAGLVSFSIMHGYPVPVVHDELAYLLTADTFLQGRLTNPPPSLSDFFATFHVVASPFYNGKYPPGQGLQLALGHLLGHPLHGVWVTAIILTCALFWLFKNMVTTTTAFWGVVLFSPFYTFLSYHGHSYWGGTLFALGGTLTLGGVLYCWDKVRVYPAILCGLGLGIMQMIRPLEGLIFCLIPLLALSAKHISKGLSGFRDWSLYFCLPAALPLFLGLGFHLTYNWSNTGNPFLFPYMFYNYSDLVSLGAPEALFANRLSFFPRIIHAWAGVSPFPWSFPVIMGFFAFFLFKDRLSSFWLLPAIIGAIAIVVWSSQFFSRTVWPHYVSAWFGPVGLLAMVGWQGLKDSSSLIMRRMGKVFIFLLLVVFCFSLVRAGVNGVVINPGSTHGIHWNLSLFGEYRQQIKNQLLESHEKSGRTQVVFVSYGPEHNYHEEWIYNGADIFNSPVIWARDLGEEKNRELLKLLPQHQAWSLYVKSDVEPPILSPLPVFDNIKSQSHLPNEIKEHPH